MVMEQPFTTASPILANYNWQDIEGGTGYITFYCGNTNNETDETKYTLSTHQTLSHVQGMGAYNRHDLPPDNGVISTANYDIKMNKNMTINGDVLIDNHIKMLENNSNGSSTGYVTFSLIDYDGTTETVLATADTEHQNLTDESYEQKSTLSFNIDNKVIVRGHYLRLKVELSIYNGENGYMYVWLAASPLGLEYAGMTDNTELKVNIPFDIEF